MARYLLGLDAGTSGMKALLVDEKGTPIAAATREYPLYTPHPGWTEQDPEDWWNACCEAIQAAIQKSGISTGDIAGVGFSGQMHGMVALDKDHNVVRKSILWNDQRTEAQCEAITEAAGGLDALLQMTNNRMLTGYTGSKILWMRDMEPENFEKTTLVINPKDYIRYRLCGELSTEVSDASGTGLFDVAKREWSYELMGKIGLDRSLFAPFTESTTVVGKITKQAAAMTGLPEGLKVTAGGGDAVTQTTGTGLIKPGVLGFVIGTAGNIAMGQHACGFNKGGDLQVFCGNAPGLWVAFGVTMSAGGSYRWYRDTLCRKEMDEAAAKGVNIYDYLGQEAATVAPGADGVLFMPWLSGERSPYYDSSLRAGFLGLGLHHNHATMTRAVLEGVTYSMKKVADVITATGSIVPEKIIVSGGGALSPLWRSILADVNGLPVITVSGSGEGGAYGAALVAGAGLGVFKDINEALSVLTEESETLPNAANKQVYQDMYGIYGDLYGALQATHTNLAKTY